MIAVAAFVVDTADWAVAAEVAAAVATAVDYMTGIARAAVFVESPAIAVNHRLDIVVAAVALAVPAATVADRRHNREPAAHLADMADIASAVSTFEQLTETLFSF